MNNFEPLPSFIDMILLNNSGIYNHLKFMLFLKMKSKFYRNKKLNWKINWKFNSKMEQKSIASERKKYHSIELKKERRMYSVILCCLIDWQIDEKKKKEIRNNKNH